MAASSPSAIPTSPTLLDSGAGRKAILGFLLLGHLFSLAGVVLPIWGFHLRSNYSSAAWYFLMVGLGIIVGFAATPALIRLAGVRWLMVGSCLLSGCGSLVLGFLRPEAGLAIDLHYVRLAGFLVTGAAATLITGGSFEVLAPHYRLNQPAVINLCALFFTLGAASTAYGVSYLAETVSAEYVVGGWCLLSFLFALVWMRGRMRDDFTPELQSWREAIPDFKSPGATFFALLVFVQFANEWTVAGWLPLYLIQQIGLSPATALGMLALFWTTLLLARVVSQFLLSRYEAWKVLAGAIVLALLGTLLIEGAATSGGGAMAVIMLGCGFAPVFPMTVDRIEHRFPYFHPGVFSALFLLGMAGALMVPSLFGLLANYGGVSALMLGPVFGSVAVGVLVLLIWLEARLTKG